MRGYKIDEVLLRKLHVEGKLDAEMAILLDCAVSTVQGTRKKLGLALRRKYIDTCLLKQYVEEGKTTPEIARLLNFTESGIRDARFRLRILKDNRSYTHVCHLLVNILAHSGMYDDVDIAASIGNGVTKSYIRKVRQRLGITSRRKTRSWDATAAKTSLKVCGWSDVEVDTLFGDPEMTFKPNELRKEAIITLAEAGWMPTAIGRVFKYHECNLARMMRRQAEAA